VTNHEYGEQKFLKVADVIFMTAKVHGVMTDQRLHTSQRKIRLTADVASRRHLRSSTTTTLVVPPVQRSTLGDCAFPIAAPCVWNSLPPVLITLKKDF